MKRLKIEQSTADIVSQSGLALILRYTGCLKTEVFMAATEPKNSAKVFMAGMSQAIRLPKRFRFPDGCEEVSIRQYGNTLVLTPRYGTWEELFADMKPVDDNFVAAVLSVKEPNPVEDAPRASFDE